MNVAIPFLRGGRGGGSQTKLKPWGKLRLLDDLLPRTVQSFMQFFYFMTPLPDRVWIRPWESCSYIFIKETPHWHLNEEYSLLLQPHKRD